MNSDVLALIILVATVVGLYAVTLFVAIRVIRGARAVDREADE